ncbi:hypothetical protein [Roseateles sp.]|uniref:hypothetical protein n=1 Tax=Roseateles sp. TaxID=1971397 RepID=UPI0025FD6DB5|nr:hypothetical protein [Roseateles sp.]MBV8037354.1 hypothetical protein [Roseateles sp.]
MLTNIHQHTQDASSKPGDAVAWGTIFSFATAAVGLLFWMGSASHAGEPLTVVLSIGGAALSAAATAAAVAVRFSRRP